MTFSKPCFISTFFLLGGIVVILFFMPSSHSLKKIQVLNAVTPELIQQMQQQNKMLVLILGRKGCPACEETLDLIQADEPLCDFFSQQAYFCYMTFAPESPEQKLMNSLFQTSHPTTYIFQPDFKLYSYIASMKDYTNTLKKCIHSPTCINLHDYSQYKNRYSTPSLLGKIKPQHIKGMLENSFAGSVYLQKEPRKARDYLQKSLQYGTFFYNAYLMYKCQCILKDSLQIEKYKNLSLQNQSSLEWYLFEKELRELGADMPQMKSK